MKVTITKPDSSLYDAEARLVQLPGTGGKFEILTGHAPIIASLGAGQLRLIAPEGTEHLFDIRGGVVKSDHDDLTILVQ